jgi:hypothetical protein
MAVGAVSVEEELAAAVEGKSLRRTIETGTSTPSRARIIRRSVT